MMAYTAAPAKSLFQDDELTEATNEREEVGVGGLPSEAQMVLLCLDYLRDLRRSYTAQDLVIAEGLDADHLSVAIYSLSRSFLRPPQLLLSHKGGNDAWLDKQKASAIDAGTRQFPPSEPKLTRNSIQLPDLKTINTEIMYSKNQHPNQNSTANANGSPGRTYTSAYTSTHAYTQQSEPSPSDQEDEDPSSWYDYDDAHVSNSHRFYLLNGLASGPVLDGPLTLGEITAAGLAGLGARSRLDAERDMIKSPLFEQFVEAVRSKGFFRDPDTEIERQNLQEELERQQKAQEVYEDRYRKVVAKFRTKLATKAQSERKPAANLGGPLSGNLLALSAADRQRRRRQKRIEMARLKARNQRPTPADGAQVYSPGPFGADANTAFDNASVATSTHNVIDLEEAERLKSQGNVYMQKKDYQEAADSYTAALKLSPAGPQSHVYFSNRAASLLSMKMFKEAILDSERSLALKPDYGKAHARLGLAHFLLGDYRKAMEAYTVALKYDPENKSSKNYLEKAARRLAKQEKESAGSLNDPDSSYSVVSEWDKSVVGKPLNWNASASTENQDERKKLIDQKEAEKHKLAGNSYMASRDYQSAWDEYSTALELCPRGPNSHVYFSNRAASLCYLERYEDAEADSKRSLALEPTYGKAHARLGLSRFFLGDYQGAVLAYTAALAYDPDSSASKSYLAKAKARLQRENSREAESPMKEDP
jgi:tetratricopeptide (TPR) repeat protein